ncbi:glycerophosphodiester phosphodiesterase [Maribacter sp. X9]|uniref:glycerophosphodiester phosphodiesterase n=1 Tax=Maribacter sp. X9 TaxID=3402159 RepID=UPI003AF371BA
MKSALVIAFLLMHATLLFAQGSFDREEHYILPKNGICAHRGANETHPENTIAAFKEAIRLGAQMIEFDVQMTKDNQLVIMHDDKVNRTTNGHGKVRHLSLRKIKKLDAGKWKSKRFKNERVPTLKEVLEIMPTNIWLNIHLKGDEILGIATAKAIMASGRIHQAIIACESEAAKGVRKVNQNIKICNMERLASRADYIDGTIDNGFQFLQLKSNRDDENRMTDLKKLKEHGILICYFHAEEEIKVKELLEAGVNFILTNHLSDMLDAFSRTR